MSTKLRDMVMPRVEEAIAETRRRYVGTPPNVDANDELAASVLRDVEERLRAAFSPAPCVTHEFAPMTCVRCGTLGHVSLSVVGTDERLVTLKEEETR